MSGLFDAKCYFGGHTSHDDHTFLAAGRGKNPEGANEAGDWHRMRRGGEDEGVKVCREDEEGRTRRRREKQTWRRWGIDEAESWVIPAVSLCVCV